MGGRGQARIVSDPARHNPTHMSPKPGMLFMDRETRDPRTRKGAPTMSKNVKIALIVLGLGALVALLVFLRREKTIVDAATAKIEDAIDELDPAARAAVVARLGIEAKDKVLDEVHARLG